MITISIYLPPEIWLRVFDLAVDDFSHNYALPTVMAESAWFLNVFGEWSLRSTHEAMNTIQRRSFATKKALSATCSPFNSLAKQFMFRSLFFSQTSKLSFAHEQLTPEIGWYTTRLQVAQYATPSAQILSHLTVLPSILRNTPNLTVFVVDYPIGSIFGDVVDALSTYCSKSLRTVKWIVPAHATSKAIWALASLPFVSTVHIEFTATQSEYEFSPHLGSASELALTLPALQHLTLRGAMEVFIEQATGWSLPRLRVFSIDSLTYNPPDVLGFVKAHGLRLVLLDLNTMAPLRIADILACCPDLKTFAFNPDARVSNPIGSATSEDEDDEDAAVAVIVRHPHESITYIGCHGLSHAFGVGNQTNILSPLRTTLIHRTNDINFSALASKTNFPNLQCVRVLGEGVLRDLEKAGGPRRGNGEAGDGWKRWERWWGLCERGGIRLEDCTGALLGTLPEKETASESESGSGSELGESEEEEYSNYGEESVSEGDYDEEVSFEDDKEFGFKVPVPPRERVANSELRQLLKECRKMAEEREEGMFSFPPAF